MPPGSVANWDVCVISTILIDGIGLPIARSAAPTAGSAGAFITHSTVDSGQDVPPENFQPPMNGNDCSDAWMFVAARSRTVALHRSAASRS